MNRNFPISLARHCFVVNSPNSSKMQNVLTIFVAGKKNKGNTTASPVTSPECPKCDDVITTFNDWHGNANIVCSRYQDPRDQFDPRGACKECKVQCVPTEEKCPGITEIKAGHWWRTGVKLMEQYVERAELQSQQREQAKLEQRRKNNFAKEQAKVNQSVFRM